MPITATMRSSRACQLCRSRKVKCDVARTGIPCSNCARSSASCSVQTVRKSRHESGTSRRSLPQENLFTFEVGPQEARKSDAGRSELLERPHKMLAPEQHTEAVVKIPPERTGLLTNPKIPPKDLLSNIPQFVTPLSSEINRDSLHLLSKRGCLNLPEQAMLEEVMGVYTCYVHPLLPLIDIRQTLDAIHFNNGTTISLLILHAIIFAASAFMDSAQISAMGLGSRPDTRRCLFNRVKLLYEMDVENNTLVMIQSLLLMTYWYGQQNDTKGRMYWLRTAMFLAIDIGLDRESQQSLSKAQRILRRRVWYSCIMREGSLALTERRAACLQSSARTSSNLNLEYFEDSAFREALNLYYMHGSDPVADVLARLCMQNVRLSLLIGRILDSQYQLTGIRHIDSSEVFMVLIPTQDLTTTSKAILLEEEIQKWRLQTAAIAGSRFGLDHRGNGRVLGVHSATLELLYLTALSMIHKPLMLHESDRDSATATLQAFSQRELRAAARRVSEICRQLQDGNLMRFLPPLAVGAFIISSVQHLKDAMSPNSELCSSGHLFLNQTLDALSALKDMYNSATCASNFIQRVKSGALSSRTFEWEASTESTLYHDAQFGGSRDIAWKEVAGTNLNLADAAASTDGSGGESPSTSALGPHAHGRADSDTGVCNGENSGNDFRIGDISDIFFSAAIDMNQIEWIDSVFDRV